MGRIVTGFSMSLDGFVAGPNDDVQHVFKWYSSGDTEYRFPSGTYTVMVSPASARVLQEAIDTTGALVTGRRTFDITQGWNGRHPMDLPVVVVTHTVPREWVKEGSPFTFVTDGVESAIEKARAIAGDKNVAVGGPSIVQQCLRAGLLDEIHIDLAPVLLGSGVRLFDHIGAEPVELERTRLIEAPGVTHITFRVLK